MTRTLGGRFCAASEELLGLSDLPALSQRTAHLVALTDELLGDLDEFLDLVGHGGVEEGA